MDVGTIRIVVLTLGLVSGFCAGGVVVLAANHVDPPPILGHAITVAIGGILGILATPRTNLVDGAVREVKPPRIE